MAQAVKTETIETAPERKPLEVSPRSIADSACGPSGMAYRSFTVRMPEGAISDDLRDPKIWRRVQCGQVELRLQKLDHLFILGHDESWFAYAVVTHATDAEAALAITKVGTFREVGEQNLFSDGTYRVSWEGVGYGVRRVGDGVLMGAETYTTESLAISALKNLYPRKVA